MPDRWDLQIESIRRAVFNNELENAILSATNILNVVSNMPSSPQQAGFPALLNNVLTALEEKDYLLFVDLMTYELPKFLEVAGVQHNE